MHGFLILDKPTGITSAHAVAKVKRLLKPSKIGHAGTLDPLASGVLPLALGEATKVISYMVDASKAYTFTATWGEQRDTDDLEGKPTATSDNRPTREHIEALLPQFTGPILQTPPNYSAIKVDGKRAYDMARGGEALELKPREVQVDSLIISSSLVGEDQGGGELSTTSYMESYPPPNPLPEGEGANKTTFLCHCGKGTYIRSLARDMGLALGCFGHISALRRVKVGKFTENHAISLEVLGEMVHKDDLGFLLPVESVLDDIPAFEVTLDQAALLKRGQFIPTPHPDCESASVMCRGTLVAMAVVSQGMMRPVRVFNL